MTNQSSFFQKTIQVLAIAALLAPSIISPPKADASWDGAVSLLRDSWGSIVSYAWSPWNTQVFMTNLSWQETRDVQNQYRSRANGVLHDRCVEKIARTYLSASDWQTTSANRALKTTHRWMVASRVENGQANCYLRMPNDVANKFKNARGW